MDTLEAPYAGFWVYNGVALDGDAAVEDEA